jgi:hypothetical protein
MEHGDYGPPKSMASGTGIGNKSQKRARECVRKKYKGC